MRVPSTIESSCVHATIPEGAKVKGRTYVYVLTVDMMSLFVYCILFHSTIVEFYFVCTPVIIISPRCAVDVFGVIFRKIHILYDEKLK